MLTSRRPLRSSNATTPFALANRVKSTPRPTLWPGKNRVPRCRTRIEPAVTHCPENRLTPSILGWLSRPFLGLPTPFLCAMDWDSVPSGARFDAGDPHRGERLAMALPAPVVLPALELHDDDLLLAAHSHDLAEHARASETGGVHDGITVRAEVRHLAELHRVALSGGQTLELDHVALSAPVLLAPGDDHGFHEAASSESRGTRGCRKPRFDHTDAGLSTLGPSSGVPRV